MPIKLAFASFYTLGLLFGFLTAVILSIMYLLGAINVHWLLGSTIAINFLAWLLGPYVTDLIQKFFYKTKFLSRDVFRQTYPDLEAFIADVSVNHKIPFPKIGVIEDDNPTAYTYGSGAFNARIIFTTGLFTYLQKEEVNSVMAHEIGHIVHGDFIVMAIANTIIQILYEIAQIFLKSNSRRSGNDKEKGGSYTFVIGIIAYIFYVIGLYLVLFLNRMREVYADEFSAQVTKDPQSLSRALIKIGYGIVAKEDSAKSMKLLESTRTLGIMGFRTAKEVGLIARVTHMEPEKIAKVMLFDFVSPWAKLAELGSTHPLTGKRLARLDQMAVAMGVQPFFNIPKILEENPIDKSKIWSGFFIGIAMHYLPLLTIMILGIMYVLQIPLELMRNNLTISAGIGIFGVSIILRAIYRYPSIIRAQHTDILSLMSDPYATPVKGNPIALQGSVVGRGMPGYIFSEDMMFQDNTGLMYLDYKAGIPIIGDIIFAWKKVKQLFGQAMQANGWFFRSNLQYIVLDSLELESKKIRSYAKFWNMGMGLFFLAVAVVLGVSSDLHSLYWPAGIGAVILSIIYAILRKRNKVLTKEDQEQQDRDNPRINISKKIGIGILVVASLIITAIIFLAKI